MQASPATSHFPHRINDDGMIDSICPRCFVTIGSSNCETDLEKMESAHVCDPELVSYYEQSGALKKHPRQEQPSKTKHRKIA